ARGELVLDLHVRLAVAVEVLEAVPARAQVGGEARGDRPEVLDVVRGLLDLDPGALVDDLLADDVELVAGVGQFVGTVVGRVAPDAAALVGVARHRGEVVGVVAEPDAVVADLPVEVQAQLVALVPGVAACDGIAGDVAGAGVHAGDRGPVAGARVGDDRAAVRRLGQVAAVLDPGAVGGAQVGGARVLASAVEHRHGEGVGQVAGIAADVVVAAGLGVRGAHQVATVHLADVVEVGAGGGGALVRQPGELDHVVVGDVPVQLDQPPRIALLHFLVFGPGHPRVQVLL